MSRDGFGTQMEESDPLEELIDSAGSLREELSRWFGRNPQETAAPPAGEGAFAERLSGAALGGIGDVDPARWMERARLLLPFPTAADVSTEVDPFGLDERYLRRALPLLDLLFERWWRVRLSGIGNVPDGARLIFVANCSGVLPYDGLMVAHALAREHPSKRRPRFLVADWIMAKPIAQPLLARLGAVRACPENAELLLERGDWVVAFPEGHKGALKPFKQRYQLQRFGRSGFIPLALRRGAAIVPTAIVGAEEVHPLVGRLAWTERLLGVRIPITPTFPWLGPLGLVPLPSQWRIRFGAPIHFESVPAGDADDPLFVRKAGEQVRSAVRSLLDDELRQRNSVWS